MSELVSRRSAAGRTEVAIVYKTLPHYRISFYEKLREWLGTRDVVLRVIVGQPDDELAMRHDTATLPWAEEVRNRYMSLGARHLVWQPCLRTLASTDLVIVEQASKLLLNYVLLAWRRLGGPKVAWWGHGINLDSGSASRSGELVKRRLASSADWWFAYTEGTARIVRSLGVAADRITVTNNATDTTAIREARSGLDPAGIAQLRADLGVGAGPVGVVIGSLYPAKRVGFALDAADRIRDRIPDFHLLVIGDGPDRDVAIDAAARRPWVHALGTRTGPDLVAAASVASVSLNPGVVGLSVLDSFALDLPMITCAVDGHGPEIEYLVDGVNGISLPRSTTAEQFGDRVADLLLDPAALARMRKGCRAASDRYTIEEMTDRFGSGVLRALGLSDEVALDPGVGPR